MATEEGHVEDWIEKTCLERLAQASTNGLSEVVLCAAVSHRAPDELGFVGPDSVKRILKQLQGNGRVSYSSGRWRRIR